MTNIYVARQPILNRDQETVAYELLYRPGEDNNFGPSDYDTASLATVERSLHSFGLDTLVGDKLAFYNASRDLLVRGLWRLLPARSSVIEVLETVEPDSVVAEACRAIKNAGYSLALDDFIYRPEHQGLVDITDYIKVDFLLTQGSEREEMVQRFAPLGISMLAEKVETWEDFQQALDAGYQLFQGYFFCRPEMLATREITPLKTNLIRLVAELNRTELSFDTLESLIRQEVTLSVKLLRYLKSAELGWRYEVQSIGHAIRVLGEKAIRKWASLVAMTMIGADKPNELVTISLLRAQFCEEIGSLLPAKDHNTEFFMVGLLSTLDALMDRPMDEVLKEMPLSQDIKTALLTRNTTASLVLQLVLSWSGGDWDRAEQLADQLKINPASLPLLYSTSLAWVQNLTSAT